MTTPTRDEAVPTGWKLVPIKPTPEMYIKGGIAMMDVRHNAETAADEACACYAAMLASAPAPASGGVDAAREYAIKALYQFADCTGRHWRNVGKGGPGFVDELDGTEQIAIDAIVALSRASLSPAATPVSEAGGEPDCWMWRHPLYTGGKWNKLEVEFEKRSNMDGAEFRPFYANGGAR